MGNIRRKLDDYILRDVLMILRIDNTPTWLSGRYTLAQLAERKHSAPLTQFFCARTFDSVYVADNNVVTVWKKRAAQRYRRVKIVLWDEIPKLPEWQTLQFDCELFIPRPAATFHNSLDTLITLSKDYGGSIFNLAGLMLAGTSDSELRRLKDNLYRNIGMTVAESSQDIGTATC